MLLDHCPALCSTTTPHPLFFHKMSMNISEAEARAAYPMSSPDPSDFGNSPSGRALRKARIDCDESKYFAAFEVSSPEPDKEEQASSALDATRRKGEVSSHQTLLQHGAPSSGAADAAEEAVLRQIASSIAEAASDSGSSDDDLCSSSAESEDYMSAETSDHNDPAERHPASNRHKTLAYTSVTPSAGSGSEQRQGCCAFSPFSSASSSSLFSGSLSIADSLSMLAEHKGKLKGDLAQQRQVHNALASTAFCDFKCKCSTVEESCLDSGFDRTVFRSMHYHTYGRAPRFNSLTETKAAVHAAVWELRQPLTAPHRDGRIFSVPTWRLGGPGGKVVCKRAFIAAIGGTHYAHREALALTIAGKEPSDKKAHRAASLAIQNLDRTNSPRCEWAHSWWRQHLMWQDWLPNEMKIQYRGPTWQMVYDQFYLPAATRLSMVLSKRQWMRTRNAAVAKLHSEFFPGVSDKRLTVARSARHSKFPECTDCQKLRTQYKTLASSPKASAAQVEKAYAELLAHAAQWQQDRETAIDLRHRYSCPSSNWRYFVDDKCGSYWQQLPVSSTGRDTKENAKDKYKFAVHANVVCGEDGHKQFTFVPKNICTGANFGLTNLLMTIHLAMSSGNLKPHADCLVRHTDGGEARISYTAWSNNAPNE